MPKYLIVMSEEERAEWERKAKEDGRTLASWIRYCLNKANKKAVVK